MDEAIVGSLLHMIDDELQHGRRRHRQLDRLVVAQREPRRPIAQRAPDLQVSTRKREAMLNAQCERVQAQLSDALVQLESKDREHGELLRALLCGPMLRQWRANSHAIYGL